MPRLNLSRPYQTLATWNKTRSNAMMLRSRPSIWVEDLRHDPVSLFSILALDEISVRRPQRGPRFFFMHYHRVHEHMCPLCPASQGSWWHINTSCTHGPIEKICRACDELYRERDSYSKIIHVNSNFIR